MATLTDAFDDNSFDTATWDEAKSSGTAGDSVDEQNSQLEITLPAGDMDCGVVTDDTYDMTAESDVAVTLNASSASFSGVWAGEEKPPDDTVAQPFRDATGSNDCNWYRLGASGSNAFFQSCEDGSKNLIYNSSGGGTGVEYKISFQTDGTVDALVDDSPVASDASTVISLGALYLGFHTQNGDADFNGFAATYTSSAVAGTAAQTLAALTQAASATETIPGSAAQSLAAATQAATGAGGAAGAAAQILAAAAQAASGTESIPGAAVSALAAPTQAATGAGGAAGGAAQVLAAVVQAAAASQSQNATGTAAQLLAALTQAAAGAESFAATAAQTLAALTQAAAGVEAFAGTAAQALAALVQQGAALETVAATAAQILAALRQAGSGVLQPDGTAAQTLAALLQSAAAATTLPDAPASRILVVQDRGASSAVADRGRTLIVQDRGATGTVE